MDMGLVVRGGQGQFILAGVYYSFTEDPTRFARLRAHEVLKEQVETIVADHSLDGISRGSLDNQLSEITYGDIGKLLNELAEEGRVHSRGEKRGSRWFPGPREEGR
jgi:hypothetical protein